VTSNRAARAVLADPVISKNPAHWDAWTDGRIPPNWPLVSWVAVQNMFTADGVEHQRLREPVKRAFSPRRVSALRPRITAIAGDLLDEVADLAADGRPVDLKARFALPLPLQVICDLFGVPEPDRPHVQRLCDTAFDQGRAEVDHAAAFTELRQVLGELAAAKKRSPGDDLTSRLVTDPDSSLTDVRALLAHPEQYTLLLARQLDGWWVWADLVEETLRWASPIAALPLRYTTVPTELCGVTVPAGEALLLCYGAANRDPDHFGGDADRFDLTRRPAAHLAFGHGPHFCLGAPLARLEAAIALQELLTRFDLQPAIPPEELEPLPSLVACGVTRLPVTMSPVHRAGRKASR